MVVAESRFERQSQYEGMMESKVDSGRILLIDDLPLFRKVFPLRLGGLGRRVDALGSVEEARFYLQDTRPDLILLDVIMPGVDGFTFCQELKHNPATAGIPIIILTEIQSGIQERSIDAGADDYMPKRIDDAAMRIRVQLHMHLQELRRRVGVSGPSGGNVLVVTDSSSMQLQLPMHFGEERTRIIDRLHRLIPSIASDDRLIVLDMNLGTEEMHSVLADLRMNPDTAGLAVMLMCELEQLRELTALEFMVDDVVWKPLNPVVNRHRLRYLLELGCLGLGPVR